MDTVAITNLVLVGILFLGTAIGFAKGFLEQTIELIGVVGAFILAILLGGVFAQLLEERVAIPYSPALVISSIVLFFLGLVLTHMIAKAVGKAVKMTLLGWVDRLAGAGLGLIMAMIIASLLITATLEVPLPKAFQREVSRASVTLFLRPVAGQIFNWVVAHGPKAVQFEEIFKRSETI
jgi:membrane protein required for colicin V production